MWAIGSLCSNGHGPLIACASVAQGWITESVCFNGPWSNDGSGFTTAMIACASLAQGGGSIAVLRPLTERGQPEHQGPTTAGVRCWDQRLIPAWSLKACMLRVHAGMWRVTQAGDAIAKVLHVCPGSVASPTGSSPRPHAKWRVHAPIRCSHAWRVSWRAKCIGAVGASMGASRMHNGLV